MTLAASMALPPPAPTTKSALTSAANWAPLNGLDGRIGLHLVEHAGYPCAQRGLHSAQQPRPPG